MAGMTAIDTRWSLWPQSKGTASAASDLPSSISETMTT